MNNGAPSIPPLNSELNSIYKAIAKVARRDRVLTIERLKEKGWTHEQIADLFGLKSKQAISMSLKNNARK